ncbi:hypothetical protein HWV62_15799 [Athelia sp. TMB]|nr:hypothetical protein HWV62_15799 [Athelia sp. TMB]
MGSVDSKPSGPPDIAYPPSPPSSATVTAHSSPRLNAIYSNDPPIMEHYIPRPPLFRRANSHTPAPWGSHATDSGTDSDGLVTTRDRRGSTSSSHLVPRRADRSTTLPSSRSSNERILTRRSPRSARPIVRKSSYASSSSSSTSSGGVEETPPNPSANPGIGRKVAASLQLFKETAGSSTEDITLGDCTRPEASLPRHRSGPPHKLDGVAAAQFEFVKRSEWPDREAAAMRRGESSTGLARVRTRESVSVYNDVDDNEMDRGKERKSSTRDAAVDLARWRESVLTRHDGRGRRLERASDSIPTEVEAGSLYSALSTSVDSLSVDIRNSNQSSHSSTRSRTYPPSPSPSRSPSERVPHLHTPHTPLEFSNAIDAGTVLVPSRSPTPVRASPPKSITLPPTPPSAASFPDTPSFSPWSTDDESAWETASATTSTSTTSATSPNPLSSSQNHAYPTPFVNIPGDRDEDYDENPYPTLGELLQKSDDADGLNSGDDLDFDLDMSQGGLPHIPLRPFRNQVGGHSAIYKFTKRAVCKPLVSRENLFYESVEREAPPLLGFIPRYLGVMLVSYRRVPKGSTTPPKDGRPATPTSHDLGLRTRPPMHKSVTAPPRAPEYDHAHSTNAEFSPVVEEDEGGDTDPAEAEMPEVALDHNRHIIPQWMFNNARNRSMSHSYASPGSIPRYLRRARFSSSVASSPDLAAIPMERRTLSLGATADLKPSPLARSAHLPANTDAPLTPVNSPNLSLNVLPSSTPRVGESSHLFPPTSSDESTHRPGFRPHQSEANATPRSPGWFGGIGSTMVNTKLKDHVFSTVLRRLRKNNSSRCNCTRADDDGDMADGEDDHVGRLKASLKSKRRSGNQADCLRHADEREPTNLGIRRVQSESMIARPGGFDSLAAGVNAALGFHERGDVPMSTQQQEYHSDLDLAPSLSRRQRSRSRSLQQLPAPSAPISIAGRIPVLDGTLPDSDPTVTRQNHFILMEDLTGRMKHPCVLDLKMGTRQYGMDATLPKKKSQRKKCDRTTSRTLGVRICGMQVWNNVTQSYVTQDKYMGRDVRAEDFQTVLASFLFNGERVLAYQIPLLLQKLYALARIINRLKGYRFYGCSLLFIYDGDRESQEAFKSSFLENPSSRSKRGESLERSQSRTHEKSERPILRHSHSEDLLVGPVAKRFGSGRRKRGEVNVRIVDFAHTTTGQDWIPYPASERKSTHDMSSSQGYQADIDPETGLIYARFPPHYPDEPDRGFLFGLKNLSETLEKIWNEERIRRMKVSRDDTSIHKLPPLSTDGKEIFEQIFGFPEFDDDSGNLST